MSQYANSLPNDLLRLQSSDGARIAVSLFGGQLCSWQTADGIERLFVSTRAHWDNQRAIRGGVPIIFPQFGTAGAGPRHGFARTLPWTLVSSSSDDRDGAVMRLSLTNLAARKQFSEFDFGLMIDIRFSGNLLLLSLHVENTGSAPLSYSAALHTYLRTNVTTALISGLQHKSYRDVVDGDRLKIDSASDILIDKEIDRLYLQAHSDIVLRSDASIIRVSQTGFTEAVVWNPWVDKTALLSDCAPGDYLNFVCIEAARADRAHHLLPGQCWQGTQILHALQLSKTH